MDKDTQQNNVIYQDGYSLDMVNENIKQLGNLFPEVIKEGKVDFEALNDLLGNYQDTAEERFCLNWAGKANARREAQKRCLGTLRPCKDESKNWDTTENLFIEGDNLEVLKLLQKSYHGRIKMIYIDPPYNTGCDFIYQDDYKDNLENYLKQIGEDKSLSTKALSDSDGRFHSKWLNMMYPRLKLARNLLAADGIIFISIDDHEFPNLKKICDEIFGESNMINVVCINMNSLSGLKMTHVNKGKRFPTQKEYLLIYKKGQEQPILSIEKKSKLTWDKEYNMIIPELTKETFDSFSNMNDDKMNDILSKMRLVSLAEYAKREKIELNETWKFENSYRIFGTKSNKPLVKKIVNQTYNQQIIGYTNTDGNKRFFRTDYNKEAKDPRIDLIQAASTLEVFVSDNWTDISNDGGVAQEGGVIYPNGKKPLQLLNRIVKTTNCKEGIFLDFFAGSSTTAHSVLLQNAIDKGTRKFIMVQIPENLDNNLKNSSGDNKDDILSMISFCEEIGKPHLLTEIGKERIRRSGNKIKEDYPDANNIDVGFRVFKLDSSNIKAWDSNPAHLEQALEQSLFNIKTDRTDEDLLYELLLKLGYSLTSKIEEHEIAGKKVYEIGNGKLIVCLSDRLNTEVAEGIGHFWRQLKQRDSNTKCHVIFKDTGFYGKNGDEIKSNTILILKQHGIDNVTTI